MATGMKVWLGAVVALCILVALWALPPSAVTRGIRVSSPEEARYAEVAAELRRAHGILMAGRWSDSLSALIIDSAIDGLALAHAPSDLVTPEGDQEWRTLQSANLASLRPRDPDMTVGVVFQTDSHGALEGVLLPRFGTRSQTYVGVRDGAPYCFVVNPERYPVTNSHLRNARDLGGCTWYAKYGMPGARIAEWLESGALDFARPQRIEQVREMLDAVRGPTMADMLPFGLSRPLDEPVAVVGCLAGDAAACERAMTDPSALASRRLVDPLLVAQSPITHMAGARFTPFQVRSSYLFSDLESRYGTEAFARFWKSDLPVSIAFEAAFGEELGAWVRDWVEQEVGPFRATPAPRAATVGWSALTLLLLSGLASLRQKRRRVA